MLLTRTPLRVSIGGGGTDLPSYYLAHGGTVVSAAIDKYVYIAVNDTFTGDYLLKYAEQERVDKIDDIRHPLMREALRLRDIPPGIEIVSVADIPAGTGLGSSGSFTVGLLRALHAHRHSQPSMAELAEEACHIEIDRLGDPVGKQDQYIAAFGGISRFTFGTDGTVTVERLDIPTPTIADLEDHLLLFFTGYSRKASKILGDQHTRSLEGDAEVIDNLTYIKEIGVRIADALEGGDAPAFGRLMHEHWEHKRRRSAGISNPQVDDWYRLARDHSALGGKLVGAGAGGFLMFYAEEPFRLRAAMAEAGLAEVRFGLDHDGSVVLARS